MELKGRNILVAGMERSGIASAELLLAHGARVGAADRKPFESLSEAARALDLQAARNRCVPAIGGIELAASILQGRALKLRQPWN